MQMPICDNIHARTPSFLYSIEHLVFLKCCGLNWRRCPDFPESGTEHHFWRDVIWRQNFSNKIRKKGKQHIADMR